jgi:hypothetical protein
MVLLIFRNIHYVMIAEEILHKEELPYSLVPIPEKHAPDCGMGLEIAEEEQSHILQILEKEDIVPKLIVNNFTRSS